MSVISRSRQCNSAASSVTVTSGEWPRRWLGDSTATCARQAVTALGATSANTFSRQTDARTTSSLAISVSMVFRLTLPGSDRIEDRHGWTIPIVVLGVIVRGRRDQGKQPSVHHLG